MRRLVNWGLALGMLVLAPGVVSAGPFDSRPANTAQTPEDTAARNRELALNVAKAIRPLKLTTKQVNIEAQGGTVRLTGYILNAEQKQQAELVARRVSGVTQVDNRLQLLEQTAAPARPAKIVQVSATEQTPAAGPNNQQVAEAIGKALSEQQLNGYEIEVRYNNGVAMLSGSVATPEQWEAASQATSQVPGVQRVENRMRVTNPGMPQQPFYPVSQQGAVPGEPGPVPMQPGVGPLQPGVGPGYPPGVGPGYPPGAVPPAQPAGPLVPPPYQGMNPAAPPAYGHPGAGGVAPTYNQPNLPEYAWPSYAAYPNSAAVSYPQDYSASAWPYIGPFYPYPQVPLDWRKATLEWDDGYWKLSFDSKTDKWFWFMHPKNW